MEYSECYASKYESGEYRGYSSCGSEEEKSYAVTEHGKAEKPYSPNLAAAAPAGSASIIPEKLRSDPSSPIMESGMLNSSAANGSTRGIAARYPSLKALEYG